jgi:hypothetical protein
MAMNVRRIVTGHNASGKAVIKTDEQIAAVPRIGAGISGAQSLQGSSVENLQDRFGRR